MNKSVKNRDATFAGSLSMLHSYTVSENLVWSPGQGNFQFFYINSVKNAELINSVKNAELINSVKNAELMRQFRIKCRIESY